MKRKSKTPLADHFGSFTCKTLRLNLGITTVEEALKFSDKNLMRYKGIGKMFCYHLRLIGQEVKKSSLVQQALVRQLVLLVNDSVNEDDAISRIMKQYTVRRK